MLPIALFSLTALLLFALITAELRGSALQAWYLTRLARQITYKLEPGPSASMPASATGPYDQRLGYSRLPGLLERLADESYTVVAQARGSARLLDMSRRGVFPIFREKTQAGLRLVDRGGRPLFSAAYPERIYRDFDSIPPLAVRTLLFIENRELLDTGYPRRNPAVEWDRLFRAVVHKSMEGWGPERRTPGGSTLATQLEKFRHSPEGRTLSVREKVRQVVSASLRAYARGHETVATRRAIVVDYINSIPLAAFPGYGEVNGLGDGLRVWLGADFDSVNRALLLGDRGGPEGAERGLAYRQVLGLFLAHRRPSFYLLGGRDSLRDLTDRHLRLLAAAGMISPELRDQALRAELTFNTTPRATLAAPFAERKSSYAIRARLLPLLGLNHVYDLDRLDLTVTTTLDGAAQEAISHVLRELRDGEQAAAAGLRGYHMLDRGDPSQVVYSFLLYEHVGQANLIRVQTDNFDQPLNINEGVKLELGSTAKLRAMVNYLEIVSALHRTYAGLSESELRAQTVARGDHLTRWAIDYIRMAGDRGLPAMLDAALDRRYSASTAETFFTGGGLHRFQNFDPLDNARTMTVREAFRRSVNLVFVRLMRDIVHYYMFRVPDSSAILEDTEDPVRQVYLIRFTEREGRQLLERFERKYRGLDSEETLELLLTGGRPTPRRLAVIFRSVRPEGGIGEFAAFLRSQLPYSTLSYAAVQDLYRSSDPAALELAERGHIARVHPLELWTAGYLIQQPEARPQQVIEASAREREKLYEWLFRTRRKGAQDIRIRSLLEVEAFLEIHRDWKRQGYPFDSLVPSYATAIGSSADRPAALAELVGIILNDGMRYPTVRIRRLHFGEGTPYETVLASGAGASGERVLSAAVAAALRRELVGVVEGGTARRVRGVFVLADGTTLDVGGKTGTGDNRYEVYGANGRLVYERAVNRTATFAFTIGDRFFGVVTAYVAGEKAADYSFTSTLPVQLLKHLAPALMPLIEAGIGGDAPAVPKGPALAASSPPDTYIGP